MEHENEAHEEMLRGVAEGFGALLIDEGQFQTAALIQGGQFVVTSWTKGADSNWRSTSCLTLPQDVVPKLIALLQRAGYAPNRPSAVK